MLSILRPGVISIRVPRRWEHYKNLSILHNHRKTQPQTEILFSVFSFALRRLCELYHFPRGQRALDTLRIRDTENLLNNLCSALTFCHKGGIAPLRGISEHHMPTKRGSCFEFLSIDVLGPHSFSGVSVREDKPLLVLWGQLLAEVKQS